MRTGIHLQAGAEYRLTAAGSWTDLGKTCGPEGYLSDEYPSKAARWFLRHLEWTRRVPHANWFALICAIDSDRGTKYVVGRGTTVAPTGDGELLCFANDFWLAYLNNRGSVQLQVRG